MFITHRTGPNDTYASLSRQYFGDLTKSKIIEEANPDVSPIRSAANPDAVRGSSSTLPAGVELSIPFRELAFPATNEVGDSDAVYVMVGGQRFNGWSELSLKKAVDSFSTLALTCPYEADGVVSSVFRPLQYEDVDVFIGNQVIFRGTVIDVTPAMDSSQKDLRISAYAYSAVLGDVTASPFANMEFTDLSIGEIASRLSAPFGIEVTSAYLEPEIEGGMFGFGFGRVKIGPNQKILSFLTKLVQQHRHFITNDADGNLVIRAGALREGSAPVAFLREGEAPLAEVSARITAQEFYSHITARRQSVLAAAGIALFGRIYTAKNPLLKSAFRPYSFDVEDAGEGELKRAAEAKLGQMLASSVTYEVTVPTWRDPQGNLWEENTFISLQAPSVMVTRDYTFLIRGVSFERTATEQKATLSLVLPAAFSEVNILEEGLPWTDE